MGDLNPNSSNEAGLRKEAPEIRKPTETKGPSHSAAEAALPRGGPIRVVLAKLGLDGHDRGVRVVARVLRDAGMEVIYTGLWQSPRQVARAAAEEDADAVGISLLSGAHLTLVPRLLEALRSEGAGEVPVVVGGIVPEADAAALRTMGVARVLGPGASLEEIVRCFEELAAPRGTHAP